ncbi:MAG: hypothetical protein JNM41_03825 [Flavipsychrobacter sp.]|nr:hypothetical protein [Flavipsychrobacter sp.]
MQRKMYIFCLALAMIASATQAVAQKGKSEFALGYGRFSIYQFANRPPYNTSSGTFSLTYRYYLSPTVTLGLGFGQERISNWASFASFIPEVTFKYLDTKDSHVRVRLYGSVGYGFSVLTDLHPTGPGQVDESGAKPWGFQATPIGIRIGRQFAGFAELGLGYKGLLHGGIAWRFPKHWRNKEVETDQK